MNRYVGLRYVNKFFDDGNGGCEWNNTIAFEALTTVTHLGNSYISKQAVPIGIDISNTIYWTKTNDYDAQLNNYKTSTNEEISNTNTNIGTLNLLETTNKTNIVAAINEQNTALMENTNRIKDIYINVKGLGFLAKGDGISDDTQAIQTAINALSDSGGTIYIPRGTYITSSDLIFENKNKITIRGEFIHHGYDSNSSMLSIIKSNANNGYIINLRKAKNIKIEGLELDGNNQQVNGIYLGKENSDIGEFGYYSLFHNNIHSCNTGISAQNSSIIDICNNNIGNNKKGIVLTTFSGDCQIHDNYINTNLPDDVSTSNIVDGCGIFVGYGSNNINIYGGKIEWNKRGIVVENSQGINIHGIQFDTNRCSHIYLAIDNNNIILSQYVQSIQIIGNRFLAGCTNLEKTSIVGRGVANDSKSVSNVKILGNDFKKGGDLAYNNNNGNNIGAYECINALECSHWLIANNDMIDGATDRGVEFFNTTPNNAQHIYQNNQTNLTDFCTSDYLLNQVNKSPKITGSWDSPLEFTSIPAYLWVDSSGTLRIKQNTKPTSATDGTIVGNQS